MEDIVLLPADMKRARYGEGVQDHDLPMTHSTKVLQLPARLACALVERWGMVAADDGGEDSQGRAKLKLQSVPDLVERACATAEALCNQLEIRGWVLDIPLPIKREKEEKEPA